MRKSFFLVILLVMNILLFFLLSTVAFAHTFTGASFRTKYEETGISKTGKSRTTLGHIDYMSPSRLKIEVTSPDPGLILINETGSWFYQPPFIPKEKGLVTVNKGKSHPALKVFEALGSGLKNTALYDYSNDGKVISLIFKPKARAEFGIEKLVLKSSKGPGKILHLSDVEVLQIHESKEIVKTMVFKDFEKDVNFDPGYFTFKMPENTKVNEN